ncbi:MAG: outer membrane protein transport protein [Rhodobacteraceae bacterium]|nr:outer membrane protein transport protein [Paracoccaceae bacterium]
MKNVTTGVIAALLASTAMASAGGIERTNQSVDIIFEERSYVEFSYGYVDPSVSGDDPTAAPTGDLSPAYSLLSGGFKTDLSDKISVAVIFDQPFGSNADYPLLSPVYSYTTADLKSSAVSLVASYDITENVVVYGGASYQAMSATASLPFVGTGYTVDATAASGFGYIVGAAYQIPEIALRVALTYRSEITANHQTTEAGLIPSGDTVTSVTTPQSVNLEFQTGVNEKTLIFGSVRWVEWSKFELSPPDFLANTLTPLVSYEFDRITYNLGVGRTLTENLSGALTVGYEATLGSDPSPLAPTDGFLSVGAGLTYAFDNVKVTGGAKYLWLGDASGTAGTFENNTAMAFGLKVAFTL